MKYNKRDIDRIARNVMNSIEDEIVKSGIFYRIFFRCKEEKSLSRKISLIDDNGKPKYDGSTKFLRDIIGIRINLYFVDDLEITTSLIKKKFSYLFVEETIDENLTTEFKPTRTNLIFKIPGEFVQEFKSVISDDRIDSTFELQLRTIFSEGWHEVEHDLRYKCKDDWNDYPELSRTFNGVLASLETHEWSMIQLFERLSYCHYKNCNISAMIRTKFRIRLQDFNISHNLIPLIKTESLFLKELFKIERYQVISFLLKNKPIFPLTIDNLVFLINYMFLKNEEIIKITPSPIIEELNKLNAFNLCKV